ncbi:uncharacterized protein TNCV_221901 [Trichonephila clavipes]|nr:uncharacterized protein TNCV_221901 [Trichonephila clavipes]
MAFGGSFATSLNVPSSQSEVITEIITMAPNDKSRESRAPVLESFRTIFFGVENIDDFWRILIIISHIMRYPQLACAYLKGHLKGRALDWFVVLGYRVIEDKTTDYAHLKQALSEQFPVVRNRQENWRENRNNEIYANNSRPQREFNRFENQGVHNNRRFEGRRQSGQSDQPFHSQGGRQSGSRNSSFRGQNERSRNLNF